MTYRIALVEDNEALLANYSNALEEHGYHVDCYCCRIDAINAFKENLPDLAILDIELQNDREGGFEICRELRFLSKTIPIIFLTAKDLEMDKASGLRIGAWEYILKSTTTLMVLPLQVAALFKVVEAYSDLNRTPTREIIVGSLKLLTDFKQAYWKGSLLNLSLTEFQIVSSLALKPGVIKTFEQLKKDSQHMADSTMNNKIRRIRGKFKEFDSSFNHIISQYGVGYKWRFES